VSAKNDRNQPSGRRGKRAAQGIYLVVAAGFVVLSTWEVERQVFGAPVLSRPTEASCSFAVTAFDDAITRGLSHAALEHSMGKSEEAFENTVSTPLSAVEKHCTADADRGAFLAATRLRDAAEATIDTQYAALAPLRTALQVRRNP
jgi:hypothetical protein